MCGLVAMYTSRKNGLAQTDANEFFHLLLLNSVRGSDSTGLAGVDMRYADQTPDIVKVWGNPYNLQNFEDYDTFMKRVYTDYTLVMGHGRAATQGAVNAVNAHPFKVQHITMAHNGTISNFKALQKEKKLEHIEVDSQLVCHLFATEGVEATVAQLEGAYAFIWYDAIEGTFNVLRNYQRPLFYAKYVSSDTLVFASEKETLIWNATRNKTTIQDIQEVPALTMLTWDGTTIQHEVRKVEPKKYSAQTSYGQNGYRNGGVLMITDRSRKDNNLIHPIISTSMGGIRIAKGEKITVSLVDYFPRTNHGYTSYDVVGQYEDFVNYVFECRMFNLSEDELIKTDFFKGTVADITYKVVAGESIYKITLINCDLVKTPQKDPVVDDDDYIELQDAGTLWTPETRGEPQKISKWRATQLAEKGCAWCTAGINPSHLIKEPSIFGIWGSEIVCPKCVAESNEPTSKCN